MKYILKKLSSVEKLLIVLIVGLIILISLLFSTHYKSKMNFEKEISYLEHEIDELEDEIWSLEYELREYNCKNCNFNPFKEKNKRTNTGLPPGLRRPIIFKSSVDPKQTK